MVTAPEPPQTERRLCTVLFVDLVGFTPLSESRDPEEVRELLSEYFSSSRTIVERYGGTVEKFIGDAVMAVWGTPRALEGDTERAVRAALDVVAAVADLGDRLDVSGLAARAGVVTGEVAVNLEARGEGMVAGDAVNTAARVQSAAPAGDVLVDAATRRLASPAIDFADAGSVVLKGKSLPESLWTARHVASGVGGSQRVDGLEAPFVGRELEFRLVKDLLHTVAQDREPRLVVVSGAAGVGKSRLGWEFEKYVDGIAEGMFWHRGRCLPFGEDIAFWALTEIVRGRIGASEADTPEALAAKLDIKLDELFEDDSDRDFVFVRLARLLSLPSPASTDLGREELFAGWRRFFEKLAQIQPVLLLIEDAQYADLGLLDFIEHMIDWSRDIPLMVLVFTRPEIETRRPRLGAGRRRTLITLEPLPAAPMRRLLEGLVPHLPAGAADAISRQAEGIPLFAVETVRSLIDQDVVIPREGVYTLISDVGDLPVPESLHALLAARIDALDPMERSLVADAAILGSNFMVETLVSVSDLAVSDVEAGLQELVRRDVLQVSADRLSPQLGSYSFTHGLLAQVAYSTLSRRDLKSRHRRVAQHLQESPRNEGDALAEVIARHYLDALKARPDDDDIDGLRALAASWLERAGERAVKSGGQISAARLFASAAELTEQQRHSDRQAADLWMKAAQSHLDSANGDGAVTCATNASQLFERTGDLRLAARARARVGRGHQAAGRANEARDVLAEAVAVLEVDPDVHTVASLADLAGIEALMGGADRDRLSQRALELGQQLDTPPEIMADLMSVRGVVHSTYDRLAEAEAYYREGMRIAENAGRTIDVARAMGNLADACLVSDPRQALTYAQESVRLARLVGARWYVVTSASNVIYAALAIGDWDLATATARESLEVDGFDDIATLRHACAMVWALQGDSEYARNIFGPLEAVDDREEPQDAAVALLSRALIALAEGDRSQALEHALATTEVSETLGIASDGIRWGWPIAARAAFEMGEAGTVEKLIELLDRHPVAHLAPVVRAELELARARLLTDATDRAEAIATAVEMHRTVESPYHLAQALLDEAEARIASNPADNKHLVLIEEAHAMATSLGARLVTRRAEALGELSAPALEVERTSP